jgi:hypothetical protein
METPIEVTMSLSPILIAAFPGRETTIGTAITVVSSHPIMITNDKGIDFRLHLKFRLSDELGNAEESILEDLILLQNESASFSRMLAHTMQFGYSQPGEYAWAATTEITDVISGLVLEKSQAKVSVCVDFKRSCAFSP